MQLIHVGAAVLNQTPLDWIGNQRRIVQAIGEARAQGVQLLCLPELCLTGYGCEDAFHSPDVREMAWRMLQEVLPETRGMIVCFGLPVLYNNGLFNCVALVADGKVLGFKAKHYLAGDGIHYEPRWFKPWPGGVHVQARIDGQTYPLGDLVFDVGGVRLGFEICEDAWVAARPGSQMAHKGVDVILNPSASHFAFGKIETRKRFVVEGSRAFGVTYVYANLVGNEAGRVVFDGGALIASGGKLLAAGPRLTFRDVHVTSALVDLELTRMNQVRSASFRPEIDGDERDVIVADFTFSTLAPVAPPTPQATWETSASIKEEEFTRAVALGLFDYLRKSRSGGFAVSLSGGADSAAVACLVKLMVDLGTAELGREGFLAKLSHLPRLQEAADNRALVSKLLTCAYQATEHSGDVTRQAARTLAGAIGADHHELDVDALFKGYVAMIEWAIGRSLTWDQDDITLQNIQARVRAPGIWMLANIRNALLLATSNRSEAAVGYATMDGDTCGGLSPIAGIDKAFLRRWLHWLQTAGPEGLGPIPELHVITQQAPTAELRPASEAQTDEGDLMPYELLDAIERAAIRDKQSPVEILAQMSARFPQWSRKQLAVWIERFFTLWCRNQWKRERYAPSFHLDDENLDPKTWCRFPILSGGFEVELAELRAAVKDT